MHVHAQRTERRRGQRWFTLSPANRYGYVWALKLDARLAGTAAVGALARELREQHRIAAVHHEGPTTLLIDGYVARVVLVEWCDRWWSRTGASLSAVPAASEIRAPQTARRPRLARLTGHLPQQRG